jgi:hypothetical protein
VPQIAAREGKMAPSLDASAAAALGAYPYPGNVRELLHALERGVAMTRDGVVRFEHLPAEFAPALPSGSASALGPAGEPGLQPLGNAVREFEQGYIVTTGEKWAHFHRHHRGPRDHPVAAARFFARADGVQSARRADPLAERRWSAGVLAGCGRVLGCSVGGL